MTEARYKWVFFDLFFILYCAPWFDDLGGDPQEKG